MAWLIQEVPDPKESVGCGSIILTIIGAIIIIWAISSSDKSESHDTDSPSIPIEPKTEQVQQPDVKKSVSPTSQTNLPLKANPAAAPANTAKPQIKATVSPTKKSPTQNNTTKNTPNTPTTISNQVKSTSAQIEADTSALTEKERRKAERQAKKEAKRKEKAKKNN